MTPGSRGRALAALLTATIAASTGGGNTRGAGRDTAFYPVSAHDLSPFAAPPLAFEKLFEATLAGTPSSDPLEAPAHDGDPVTVRTTQGTFLLDARTGELRESRPPVIPPSAPSSPEPAAQGASGTSPAGALSCVLPGGGPRWLRHLHLGAPSIACLQGPGGILAIIGRDGSLFGREQRGGHLFWRRTAAHRISRPPVSLGPYLLMAPDASRELQALRWSDGSPAGVFRLDSEDAYFVSAPVASGDRLYVLAVDSPRPETRLIALVPRQQIGLAPPSAGATPAHP